jgi:hypothetical protein
MVPLELKADQMQSKKTTTTASEQELKICAKALVSMLPTG